MLSDTQDSLAALARATDLRWLGFSYIAFRLLHTLRDRQTGRLPGVTLEEYFIYILFFPAFTAGPIDRIERFITDLRSEVPHSAEKLGQACVRLLAGTVKKFVLADLLSMMALSGANAAQVHSTGWTWIPFMNRPT